MFADVSVFWGRVQVEGGEECGEDEESRVRGQESGVGMGNGGWGMCYVMDRCRNQDSPMVFNFDF